MEQNLAVVGCGDWGRNLIRIFAGLGALRMICDTDATRLCDAGKKLPGVGTTRSFDAIPGDRKVSSVAIATPAASHFHLARRALEAGKDVFVEKPLAMTVQECEELIRLADEGGRILMVDHILRYHPAVAALKKMADGGELGQIRYIHSSRLNIGKLRKEEDILWSFAPHDISVMLWLANELPARVSAFGEAYLQDGVYDTTVTVLTFRNKLKAHLFVSWLHPFKEQKMVAVGSRNMAVFDDLGREKLCLYPHTIAWVGEAPVASRAERIAVPVPADEPLRNSCAHFLECVSARRSPLTDGREGLAVLKVLRAAQRSLRLGGEGQDPAFAA